MKLKNAGIKACVGLFLMGIGLAMIVFGIIYLCSGNMNYAWCGFGLLYALSIIGIFMNRKLKDKLGLKANSKIMKPLTFVVLAIGLVLSFTLGAKVGDRGIILGVLISVGLHFIPLKAKGAYVLALLVIINGIIGFVLSSVSVVDFVFIDGLLKILTGIVLIMQGQNQAVTV